MPDALNPQITDTIAVTNAKTLAEGTSFATNSIHQRAANAVGQALENATANQQAMNNVALTGMQMFTKRSNEVDPTQAHALSKLGGSDLAMITAQLAQATAAIGQLAKLLDRTPPVGPGA